MANSRWPFVKELIKLNWDLLDEDEIDSFRGRLDLLSDKIQATYNISKEKADFELQEFRQILNAKNSPLLYLPKKNFLY
jgi:hypothetical protein